MVVIFTDSVGKYFGRVRSRTLLVECIEFGEDFCTMKARAFKASGGISEFVIAIKICCISFHTLVNVTTRNYLLFFRTIWSDDMLHQKLVN